jgi:hypothetical protein
MARPMRLLPGMFDIAAWEAGVVVSRSCAAASIGTKPGRIAIAAIGAMIAIDRIFVLLLLRYCRQRPNCLLRARDWRMQGAIFGEGFG